ncbi:MAG: SDR family oxidoreductase [Burkholderiales bacterium]
MIIVSSIAALKGNTVIGLYGVSKAADTALVRNYACEWGPSNIRVNAILPGLIKTDFARAVGERQGTQGTQGDDAAAAPGRSRGNRWHRGVPCPQSRQFHHRPDDRCRRRRDHRLKPAIARADSQGQRPI